ncbi:MAG: toxin-antitoxin system protein [Clostridiales bacterium]|nr:toxin-antitoxin system protein [Clostridiales bacterium]
MKPIKKQVSVTLDIALVESIKILAESCDRSFSQYINLVLRDHLAQKATEAKEVESE